MKLGTLVLAFLLATITITESTKKSTSNDDLHAQLVDLQRRHVDWLLDHPHVTAVDVNYKTVGGEQTDQLSLVIWVKKKLPEEDVLENQRLPREIEGFQTDVVEGEIELGIGDCTCRPSLGELRGGHCIKIKNSKKGCGTLGYFTKMVDDPTDIGILSNYHVTCETGNKITSRPRDRDKVAANRKKNHPQHYVAEVTAAKCNKVDASHSTLCTDPPAEFMLEDGTVVKGTQTAELDDSVRFCGCTSGCTNPGIITSTSFCTTTDCSCDSQTNMRCNQILFTPAAMDGDSGSLLINADTKNAVGLVYASTKAQPVRGVANPIKDVLDELGVTLAEMP